MSQRQLAAIMFTDIVGYTALMGKDSNKALRLVRQSKHIQKPLVERHGGKWLKEMGDGAMAQFGSALDAVNCAIEIQQTSQDQFDATLRIGIHLGDITIENNDIYGDGVNVAARLESIADPGGIYISNSIEKAIRGQADIQTRYIGEVKLKNVDYDVRIFAIQGDGLTVLTQKRIGELSKKANGTPYYKSPWIYAAFFLIVVLSAWLIFSMTVEKDEIPITSLAVLPFKNLTGDSAQGNFIIGIQDNLITELSKISALDVVISRTSTVKYKNTELTIPQIAKELGVDAIIESSVLSSADSFRINVQLIRAFPTEKHVWADIFDAPMGNILFLLDDITDSISNQIGQTIVNSVSPGKTAARAIDPEAYKAYVNGKIYAEQLSLEGFHASLKHYERSIKIDSSYAPAFAGIAFTYIAGLQMGHVSPGEAIPKIYEYNQKALELDENYPEAQYIKAVTSYQLEWDWAKSEIAYKKAISANPSHALAHAYYGHLLLSIKRFEEALDAAEKATKIDPNNALVLSLYGVVLFHTGNVDKAIEISNRSYELNPGSKLTLTILEATQYLKGNLDESINLKEKLYGREDMRAFMKVREEYATNGYKSTMLKIAKLIEDGSNQKALMIAIHYNRAGAYEEAISWLEKGVERHDVGMPYAFLPIELDTLRSDPRYSERYRELANAMNLPF